MKNAYVCTDGGREADGFKGAARDCVARAISIAMRIRYKDAYAIVASFNKRHGLSKSARNGVPKDLTRKLMVSLGWEWTPAPVFEGRKARPSDLTGRVIAKQAGHVVAVIDGCVYDTFNSSDKMVYGYWRKS